MRDRTALLLVVLLVLALVYGVAQVLKVFLFGLLVLFLGAALLVALLIWTARRRMRRSFAELQQAMQAAQGASAAPGARRPTNPNIIEVEAKEDPDTPSR